MKDFVPEIGRVCKERGITVGVAESCTGGMIAAELSSLPGASAWFRGAAVTYATDLKTSMLGVDAQRIADKGVVSAETAVAMAKGARKVLGADITLSVTGLAGPDGNGEMPVGTVFVGYATAGESGFKKFVFGGDRNMIRARTCEEALVILRDLLA